jgi:hypothetical protein
MSILFSSPVWTEYIARDRIGEIERKGKIPLVHWPLLEMK